MVTKEHLEKQVGVLDDNKINCSYSDLLSVTLAYQIKIGSIKLHERIDSLMIEQGVIGINSICAFDMVPGKYYDLLNKELIKDINKSYE